jgi:hypothetical protein
MGSRKFCHPSRATSDWGVSHHAPTQADRQFPMTDILQHGCAWLCQAAEDVHAGPGSRADDSPSLRALDAYR